MMAHPHLGRTRKIVQALFSLGTNSYLTGFATGRIYRGGAKHICVPGLNCYSCPGALGSCPIGALQTTLAAYQSRISLYALGTIALLGTAAGRFTCGWLCPFGLLQELLYKIPGRKRVRTAVPSGTPVPKSPLRYLKYLMLITTVFLFPVLFRNEGGLGETWFCAYICPAGTIEAALPLLLTNAGLRALIGWRFFLKAAIALSIVLLSLYENRPFCKFLCPLGAIYGVCNKFSIIRLSLDHDRCISCGLCQQACGMGLDPVSELDSAECIRCGACKEICPVQAISWTGTLGNILEKQPTGR